MPRLKKCPDCGGKVERGKTKFIIESEKGLIAIENIDADICTVCGAEYLTAVSDKYIEKTVEKILAKKYRRIRKLYFESLQRHELFWLFQFAVLIHHLDRRCSF